MPCAAQRFNLQMKKSGTHKLKGDFPLRKRREIARAVLEGLHGFQYCWPERAKIYVALDSLVVSNEASLVMLRGLPGVGITSILEAFASKHRKQVILVRPRIYGERINLVSQILHSVFPFSEFRGYKRVPDSLVQLRQGARTIIIIDDLDIISNQNNMYEVIFDQIVQLRRHPGDFTIVMSTRDKKLLRDFTAIKHIPTRLIPVAGLIPATTVRFVIQGFFDWCNRQYGTNVQPLGMAECGARDTDLPIDYIVFACETFYCSELLKLSQNFFGSVSELRHVAEDRAFD